MAIACLALTQLVDSREVHSSSSIALSGGLSWAPGGAGVLAEKALGALAEKPELAWPGAVREAARRVHARQEDLAETGVHARVVHVGSVEREMSRERERTRGGESVGGVQEEAAEGYARSMQTATQAERMRAALARVETHAPRPLQQAVAEARHALKDDPEAREGGGVAALERARGILSQAVADSAGAAPEGSALVGGGGAGGGGEGASRIARPRITFSHTSTPPSTILTLLLVYCSPD